MPKTNRKKKPAKPCRDFPLFAHATGQWAKKIRGRLVYFGVWSEPNAALEKYLEQKDYLQAGVTPPPPGTRFITLAELCNQFLTSRKTRVESGEIRISTWEDYRRSCEMVIEAFGKLHPADAIGPTDFTKLRGKITKRFGPVRTTREITQIRMVFNWGFQQELLPAPRFGSDFRKPAKDVLRRHRQKSPPKMFEAEEVRSMLEIANVHTKAWILLGMNCAFIQRDLSDMPVSAVDLDEGILDFPRVKTAIERRAILWPETIEALHDSMENRYDHVRDEDAELFFITREGNRLVRDNGRDTRSDAVHDALERVQKKLGIKQKKRSYGAFRHTFRTVADETRDFPAILRIMGHADHTISDHYRERISDERLADVGTYVRGWLRRRHNDRNQRREEGGSRQPPVA